MRCKLRFFKLCFCFVLLGVFFIQVPLGMTQDSGEELSGLLKRVVLLSAAMHSQGYTVVHIEVDKLEKGQRYSKTRKLFSSNRYKIVGIGGVGTSDVDIKLYDENMNLIDKDTSFDNVPEVDVSPKWNGNFTIQTSVISLEPGYSPESEYFFCYICGFKRK